VSDLKMLPAHLSVGMGVVDVRSEAQPSIDQIEALAAAGAAIVGPRRLMLNPDCGFAPDAGEPPTLDEASEKLHCLVTAAHRLRTKLSAVSTA
jgi:5-methyltetrahydropteroyltriglutamate--homocysteine methyltransferase